MVGTHSTEALSYFMLPLQAEMHFLKKTLGGSNRKFPFHTMHFHIKTSDTAGRKPTLLWKFSVYPRIRTAKALGQHQKSPLAERGATASPLLPVQLPKAEFLFYLPHSLAIYVEAVGQVGGICVAVSQPAGGETHLQGSSAGYSKVGLVLGNINFMLIFLHQYQVMVGILPWTKLEHIQFVLLWKIST